MLHFFEDTPNWLVVISNLLLMWFIASCIIKSMQRTPMRKLKFIEAAHKNGSVTFGKISSYIVYGNPTVHEVEYIYEVDGKVYFVTYKIQQSTEKYKESDELQPGDAIALFIPVTIPIYYDQNHPKKAMIKGEIFSSRNYLKQIKTSKNNKFRDIYKDWTGPVIL